MTIAQQLGNVGSEYGRARNWRAKNNQVYFNKAADRALELMDLTLGDSRWGYNRLREIARAREIMCEDFFGLVKDNFSNNLDKYFYQFAVLGRAEKLAVDKMLDACAYPEASCPRPRSALWVSRGAHCGAHRGSCRSGLASRTSAGNLSRPPQFKHPIDDSLPPP